MAIYKPFSVVVVPFPFTDFGQLKKRPAVVLSSEEHQQKSGHITLLMVTSAKNSFWPSDYKISSLNGTGLSAASIIRQKIFTMDSDLIIKEIGMLASSDKDETIKRLKEHLGYFSSL